MVEVSSITPFENELPSEYADRLGIYYSKNVTIEHKKNFGQFFTPIPIANLMASYSSLQRKCIRILDPGCGTAILSCALIEGMLDRSSNINFIELIAFETDPFLISYAETALNYLKVWLLHKDVIFKYTLIQQDFILHTAIALKENPEILKFDLIISNPPYFKLSKSDEKVLAVKELLGTQPNIYSIFIGIASKLLSKNGELIFITPRSFASGNYFKAFRELFFSTVQIEKIHLFNSRKDTFNRDKVLQETVIIKAIKENINPNKTVLLSTSIGLKDIHEPSVRYFQSSELLDLKTKEKILHLPTNNKEERVLDLVRSWTNVLMDYEIQISTGPVVSFRSRHYIQDNYENGRVSLAPLFWLQNVDKMVLEWPKQLKEKGQFLRIEEGSKSMLIPNKNYIFLRRFSTKDDKSRLIAAPYFSNYIKSDLIGVENKVNYIYRKNGYLDRNEIVGLCSLLNSELLDTYFQIFNGNVNVSATELREMIFPSLKDIKKIGDLIILSNDYSMKKVNEVVTNYYNLNEIFECQL